MALFVLHCLYFVLVTYMLNNFMHELHISTACASKECRIQYSEKLGVFGIFIFGTNVASGISKAEVTLVYFCSLSHGFSVALIRPLALLARCH